jgi:inner membrane protein
MTGRTHDLAAFTALSVVVVMHPVPEMSLATGIAAVFANLIGGIAPDIDQPTAPFWRNLPIGHYFGRVFDRVLGGHRSVSHSLIGVFLFGFLWEALLKLLHPSFPNVSIDIVWWAFMIGFVSHLVMDSFTRDGVPWLLPIPINFGIPPFRALRVTTGQFAERFVIFPILLIANAYLYYSNYGKIIDVLHHHLK